MDKWETVAHIRSLSFSSVLFPFVGFRFARFPLSISPSLRNASARRPNDI